ncbi:hypothetical protein MSG28_003392 [Choristoneura fumiferana]|uniref:Uncharacterized protein n=1 Tax=Choristoneura fumiferana TaxID=7141 RepID=A0ACC0KF32_CHOFU|nr:hypothetical protein MSG28_003392 [Choristoneura fumiferana]
MSEVKGTKALELWCKRLIKDCPNVQIDNMTTSWRNGIAFCALVHHFRPDLIDVATLKPENIYENNQRAFSIAEKHLGIPALLDPEDMVENEVPDRLSVLTYLSQFYQRLGHTVNTKVSESESKNAPESSSSSTLMAPIKFGKTGLDKCAACGLPVYLAQRLIVSHKLYHRRCFRCSKCSGHLNPKNFQVIEGSEFCCDSCKNEKAMPKFLNNNDQIGMLAFDEDLSKTKSELHNEEPIIPKQKSRPQSILEKINMFEKGAEKGVNLEDKLATMSITDNVDSKNKESSVLHNTNRSQTPSMDKIEINSDSVDTKESTNLLQRSPEKLYKTNINKFNFLQTQLTGHTEDIKDICDNVNVNASSKEKDVSFDSEKPATDTVSEENSDSFGVMHKSPSQSESNMTDDVRLATSQTNTETQIDCPPLSTSESSIIEPQIAISVPPRKKKNLVQSRKSESDNKANIKQKVDTKFYPNHLNPFSDDEEDDATKEVTEHVSTNPFGSSDEEDDDVPPIQPPPKVPPENTSTPVSSMYKSSLATSTPNLPSGNTRRKKVRAPLPPSLTVTEAPDHPSTSMDDVASISSLSSYTSTVHSDQKSYGTATPKLKKKRIAPTPPDSMSTMSGCGSSERGDDISDIRNNSDAPGLPLPERREVKMHMSPEQLQVQLDMLETQQLGLERQGVLIEQMIRDKCEGEDATPAPQEEVEDLVIQLCELVNEKNDLFRKQTELMYIIPGNMDSTEAEVAIVVRLLQEGRSQRSVAPELNLSQSTVCIVYQRFQQTGAFASRPRTGRRTCTSERVDRFLVTSALRHRHQTGVVLQQRMREVRGVAASERVDSQEKTQESQPQAKKTCDGAQVAAAPPNSTT